MNNVNKSKHKRQTKSKQHSGRKSVKKPDQKLPNILRKGRCFWCGTPLCDGHKDAA